MKIYFDRNTGTWGGGAWLDRLHSAGYSIEANVRERPMVFRILNVTDFEPPQPREAITQWLTEDELQLAVKLLIGGEDGVPDLAE